MIGDNLLLLRKTKGKTQDVASVIGVTRQALSKWENNESMPDIINCVALAEYYGVTVDNLISFTSSELGLPVPPKGRHLFGVVAMSAKGQIPVKARELFGLEPGDRIVVLGAEGEGIALIKESNLANLLNTVVKMDSIIE